jgi:hypothetical protein
MLSTETAGKVLKDCCKLVDVRVAAPFGTRQCQKLAMCDMAPVFFPISRNKDGALRRDSRKSFGFWFLINVA